MPEEGDQTKEDSSELIHREEIKGTPFTRIQIGNETFLTLGKYRISDKYNVDEIPEGEPLGWYILDNNQWNIIINIITLLLTLENDKEIIEGAG